MDSGWYVRWLDHRYKQTFDNHFDTREEAKAWFDKMKPFVSQGKIGYLTLTRDYDIYAVHLIKDRG